MVSTARSYLFQHGQDYRTSTQKRLVRLEVLQGKIPAIKAMILENEPVEKQLSDIKSHKLRKDIPLEIQVEWLEDEQAVLVRAISEEKIKFVQKMGSPIGRLWILLNEFTYQITGGLWNAFLRWL